MHTARLARLWSRLESLYDERCVWCRWCQEARSAPDGHGFCADACAEAHARFEAALPGGDPGAGPLV